MRRRRRTTRDLEQRFATIVDEVRQLVDARDPELIAERETLAAEARVLGRWIDYHRRRREAYFFTIDYDDDFGGGA